MNISQRYTPLLGLIGLTFLLASCAPSPEMPPAAMDALEAQWQALPGSADADLHILRAWPGEFPPDILNPQAPSMEIWCVEVQVSGDLTAADQSDSTIWIVTRQSQDENWMAAWLMTMSSLWPYEACGVLR